MVFDNPSQLFVLVIMENTMQISTLNIAGYSGSGKTTLIRKILPLLVERGHRPMVIKHSGHPHSFDQPGKDTWHFTQAGSVASIIHNEQGWLGSFQGEWSEHALPGIANPSIVLKEGYKGSEGLRLVCVHPDKGIPPADKGIPPGLDLDSTPGLLGYVVRSEQAMNQLTTKTASPVWIAGQVERWLDEVLSEVSQHQTRKPLKAAILVGGQGRRMGGQNKALMDYGRGPHLPYLIGLVKKTWSPSQIVLSTRSDEHATYQEFGLPLVEDEWPGKGPMGALFSIMQSDPQAAWLVLSCDLACLGHEILEFLKNQREPLKPATVPVDAQQRTQPLVAVYEPAFLSFVFNCLLNRQFSLQKVLNSAPIHRPSVPMELNAQLTNINHPDQIDQALRYWRLKQ